MANNAEIDKGKPLENGHFPWHVGINVDGDYFCSGALISGRHIITVAHCVKEYVSSSFYKIKITRDD